MKIIWIGGRKVTPADCRRIGCRYDRPLNGVDTLQKKYLYIYTITDGGKWGGIFDDGYHSSEFAREIYTDHITIGGYKDVTHHNSTLLRKDPRRLP